jgi:hypothetical protein
MCRCVFAEFAGALGAPRFDALRLLPDEVVELSVEHDWPNR